MSKAWQAIANLFAWSFKKATVELILNRNSPIKLIFKQKDTTANDPAYNGMSNRIISDNFNTTLAEWVYGENI